MVMTAGARMSATANVSAAETSPAKAAMDATGESTAEMGVDANVRIKSAVKTYARIAIR